jgi:hypothetical protein
MAESADRAPDWLIWGNLERATLYECLALSLNIEPRKLRHNPLAWMTGGPGRRPAHVFDEEQEFKDRRLLAEKSLGNALAGPVNWREYGRGADPEVRLATFVRWAHSVGWVLPVELSQLAADNRQSAQSGASAPAANEQATEAPAAQPVYHTGLTGRPTSWHLIEAECRRRYAAGERRPTKAEWARVLAAWLKEAHKDAPAPKEKTLSNKLGVLLRELAGGARPKS